MYSDSYQPDIMAETLVTFPNPEILTTIPYSGIERPKTDVEINYLKKSKFCASICQNLSNKDVYELDVHNI